MIYDAILALSKREDLSYETAQAVMDEIMGGKASPVQMSAYLTALSMKGETIDEITGSAAGMRAHCVKLLHDMDVLEIVGTGGDGANSFNISTTAALVIAAGGVPVAKHGNRAASSKCGAADVLEALGVNICLLYTSRSASTFSFASSGFGTPPLYLSARQVATTTTQSGERPASRHLISRNFSAPRSAPKPASVPQ